MAEGDGERQAKSEQRQSPPEPTATANVMQAASDRDNTNPRSTYFGGSQRSKRNAMTMTPYETVNLIFTGFGIVVGIVVALVYSLQLRQMTIATEAAKRSADIASRSLAISERAYVEIGDWIFGGFGAGQTVFGYRFSATGRTPATIIGGEIRMSIDAPTQLAAQSDKRLIMPLTAQTVSHLMQAQQIATFPVEVPKDDQEAWMQGLRAGSKGAIYLGGEIRYRDAFEGTPVHIRHFSFVCRGPNSQFTPNQPGLIVMNYEEDEKQQ
jgi:hypothetical protein